VTRNANEISINFTQEAPTDGSASPLLRLAAVGGSVLACCARLHAKFCGLSSVWICTCVTMQMNHVGLSARDDRDTVRALTHVYL